MLMAQTTRAWTIDELDRLPDDGNTYELIDGELFVSPPPNPPHEEIATVLHERLAPYVIAQQLGRVYRPHAVVRLIDAQVEPDLMVRKHQATPPTTWEEMQAPLLVVEVLSPTSWRRDHEHKRAFYLQRGVGQYWIVDGSERTIRVVRADGDDVVATQHLVWHPSSASSPLTLDVAALFLDALGPS